MTDFSSISNRKLANICRVVRRQRKDRGLTLEAMARETRVPLTILRQMEIGVVPKTFTVRHLFRLCRFFKCPRRACFRRNEEAVRVPGYPLVRVA